MSAVWTTCVQGSGDWMRATGSWKSLEKQLDTCITWHVQAEASSNSHMEVKQCKRILLVTIEPC